MASDYLQEQEMELEALEAILMEDFAELDDVGSSGLHTEQRCFQITISPKGDDEDEPTEIPVRLALIFSHTPNYPDTPPLLNLRSIQGVRQADLEEIKLKMEQEAQENVGMAMMYTLATSAKEWLREKYGQADEDDHEEEAKEEVIEAHGLPVTPETFLAWREMFEAELALEQAKLMPDSMLGATKEKRVPGRQWFLQKGAKGLVVDEEEVEDDDIDYDEDLDDEDIDEDDMLEHYLAGKA